MTVQAEQAPSSRRRIRAGLAAGAVVAALLAGLALAGCTEDPGLGGGGYVGTDQPQYLELTPDQRKDPVAFDGPTEDGATFDSATIAGKVTVVNFWYATCPPCRKEAPILAELSKSLTDVAFVGVNTYDDGDVARTFEDENGIAYPSLLAARSNTVLLAFAGYVPPSAVPTTLVLDRQGRVAARILGLIENKSILEDMIEKVEAEG